MQGSTVVVNNQNSGGIYPQLQPNCPKVQPGTVENTAENVVEAATPIIVGTANDAHTLGQHVQPTVGMEQFLAQMEQLKKKIVEQTPAKPSDDELPIPIPLEDIQVGDKTVLSQAEIEGIVFQAVSSEDKNPDLNHGEPRFRAICAAQEAIHNHVIQWQAERADSKKALNLNAIKQELSTQLFEQAARAAKTTFAQAAEAYAKDLTTPLCNSGDLKAFHNRHQHRFERFKQMIQSQETKPESKLPATDAPPATLGYLQRIWNFVVRAPAKNDQTTVSLQGQTQTDEEIFNLLQEDQQTRQVSLLSLFGSPPPLTVAPNSAQPAPVVPLTFPPGADLTNSWVMMSSHMQEDMKKQVERQSVAVGKGLVAALFKWLPDRLTGNDAMNAAKEAQKAAEQAVDTLVKTRVTESLMKSRQTLLSSNHGNCLNSWQLLKSKENIDVLGSQEFAKLLSSARREVNETKKANAQKNLDNWLESAVMMPTLSQELAKDEQTFQAFMQSLVVLPTEAEIQAAAEAAAKAKLEEMFGAFMNEAVVIPENKPPEPTKLQKAIGQAWNGIKYFLDIGQVATCAPPPREINALPTAPQVKGVANALANAAVNGVAYFSPWLGERVVRPIVDPLVTATEFSADVGTEIDRAGYQASVKVGFIKQPPEVEVVRQLTRWERAQELGAYVMPYWKAVAAFAVVAPILGPAAGAAGAAAVMPEGHARQVYQAANGVGAFAGQIANENKGWVAGKITNLLNENMPAVVTYPLRTILWPGYAAVYAVQNLADFGNRKIAQAQQAAAEKRIDEEALQNEWIDFADSQLMQQMPADFIPPGYPQNRVQQAVANVGQMVTNVKNQVTNIGGQVLPEVAKVGGAAIVGRFGGWRWGVKAGAAANQPQIVVEQAAANAANLAPQILPGGPIGRFMQNKIVTGAVGIGQWCFRLIR